MKRYAFSQYDGVELLSHPAQPFEMPVEDNKDKENVFNLVFMKDPLTGRPRSDLGTYMTDNCNPLVRDFIERNLRGDFSQGSSKIPDGISDFDIQFLTKDVHETEHDYVLRVNHYMSLQKSDFQKALNKEITKRSQASNQASKTE